MHFLWCYFFLIRQATTKGIWAAICNDPRAIVLDIEGSDGEEHRVRMFAFVLIFVLKLLDIIWP
jgi:hypothetical protein